MFPVSVVPVSIDEQVLPDLRRELDLAGATVEFEFPRPAAAIEAMRFSKKQTRLLVFHWRSAADTPMLKRLTATFSGWPLLALLDPPEDALDLVCVNRAGAGQVVPMPWDSTDLQDALKQSVRQYQGNSRDRHVIAVTGAAGGSGATMVAINTAAEIASQLGRDTILAEFNLRMGALDSYLDARPRFTLSDLIRQIDRVDDYLVKKTLVSVADRLRVLAGPTEVHSTMTVDPRDLLHIVDCLKILSEIVVLDLPCTFQEVEFEVLSSADHIVLVGLQNVPSVRSLRLIRDTLSADHVAMSLWVVINRYNPGLSGSKAEDIKQLLDVPRILTVADDLGAVNRASNQARTLRQASPHSNVLSDIGSLIFELLGEYPIKPENNHRSSLARFFSRQKK
ncbi:MAG: AAA family ATPase [Isosphaeraceae bacterium]